MGFVDKFTGTAGKVVIGGIRVDASVRENHGLDGVLTDHPVERGIDITDHYRVNPRVLTIEAVVSNTPINSSYPIGTTIDAVKAIATGDDQPAANAWGQIENLFTKAEIITIETSFKTYENMVLTSFSTAREPAGIDGMRFSITARELRIVDTQTVEAIAIPQTETAQKEKSRGKQNNKEANEKQTEKARESVAHEGVDKLIGVITGGA